MLLVILKRQLFYTNVKLPQDHLQTADGVPARRVNRGHSLPRGRDFLSKTTASSPFRRPSLSSPWLGPSFPSPKSPTCLINTRLDPRLSCLFPFCLPAVFSAWPAPPHQEAAALCRILPQPPHCSEHLSWLLIEALLPAPGSQKTY